MGVVYRKNRRRWGFRVRSQGASFYRFQWATRAEAEKAYHEFMVELLNRKRIPKNAFLAIFDAWLVNSKNLGRSESRLNHLLWERDRFYLPFFGGDTLIESIGPRDIERFMMSHKGRVKNNTIWHYVTDLRACFNFAIAEGLLVANPVNRADLSPIKHRTVVKAPMDPNDIERAVTCLTDRERVFFDFLRFTGLRLDEANRLEWTDVNLAQGWFHCRGSKTPGSEAILPLSPFLIDMLAKWKGRAPASDFVFPGPEKHRMRRKRIKRRTRMFEKIEKLTGIKLTAKDLRDYFATVVRAEPEIKMRLLRHKSLATTTRYLRQVDERMKDAVQGLEPLAATLGHHSGVKTPDFDGKSGD